MNGNSGPRDDDVRNGDGGRDDDHDADELRLEPLKTPAWRDDEAEAAEDVGEVDDLSGHDDENGEDAADESHPLDDWEPIVSETVPPLQFNIATILAITAAVACLFAIERFFSPGGKIGLDGVLLGLISPIVVCYFVAADRRVAVNMLIVLYFAAFFCRMVGWSTIHSVNFLVAVALMVYTSAVQFGAAFRIDLHSPLLGIPIIVLLGMLLFWGQFGQFGSLDPFSALLTMGTGLFFVVPVVFRLIGLG